MPIPVAGAWGLLERGAELEELASAAADAVAGHGGLVVVEGPAGNGKSALLGAAVDEAEAAGLHVLRARGGELERDLAFGAIRQLFEVELHRAAPDERAELLAGAAAPAAWAAGMTTDGGVAQAGAGAGFAALHGIYWLATHLSLARPLLLAVDDLQWVDEASLRALGYLARRLGDLRIALVVALRPGEPGAPAELLDALRGEPGAAHVTVHPLGAASVAALVRVALPGADEHLCAACLTASAGNPFYLGELLVTLAVDGHDADPVTVARAASIPSIADRVGRRIARVGPDAVAMARAMAVLDDGGRLADAAAVARLDEVAAATAARRLRRMEVLAREDPSAFVHPLVRRSVYDAMSVTERDEAHAAAAARLRDRGASPEAVAAHRAAVRPTGSPAAVVALRDAAHGAMARAAPQAAIRWLARALDEGAPDPPRAVLLHELGQVELFARRPEAIAHLEEAKELASDPVLRAEIALDLGEILIAAGRWEAGVACAAAGLEELGARSPELALELTVFVAVSRAFDPGQVPAFDRDSERLLAMTGGDRWAPRALAVLLASVAACRGAPREEVLPLVERGLRGGRLLAERGAGGWASAQALNALVLAEADDRALEVVDELSARARDAGALIGTMTALGYRGWIRARAGDLAAAEAELRPLVDAVVEHDMPLLVAGGAFFALDAMLERSSLEDLAATVEALEADRRFLETGGGAMIVETRGHLRLARGDREGALADLRTCGATYAALGFGPPFSFWRSALALALPPEARDEALALVDEDVRRAVATGLDRPQGVALRAAGLVRGGDEGLGCLCESVALLAPSPARLEHARSLVELGAALRRRGQRARAREPLAAGMELADACGAERLVARAGEELRATGARPRRIPRTGVAALTASEQRTARLAADGRSNTQVAQELFVSLKTVETHLSHVYAKLGLSGPGARRLLADVLEQARP